MPRFFIFGSIYCKRTAKNEHEIYYTSLVKSMFVKDSRSSHLGCGCFRKGFPHVKSSDNESIFVLIRRVWRQLNKRRKHQSVLLLGLMTVSAFTEMISLGAIVPFLAVLTAPESVFQYPYVANLASILGFTSADQLLLPLTATFCVASLTAGAVRISQLWASTRIAYSVGHDLSTAAYLRTLYQPYKKHLDRNSSEVIAGVEKVDSVYGVLGQIFILVNALIMSVGVVFALIIVDPLIAMLVFFGFGAIYGMVIWLTQKRLLTNSQKVAKEITYRLKALQEGLGGIRDVLLGGYQSVYRDIYRRSDWPLRKAAGSNLFISSSPRYFVEALGILFITILAYGLTRKTGENTTVVPIIGALAFGAQRLLPALQLIYTCFAQISGRRASLEDALALLDQPLPEKANALPPPPLDFQKDIRFETVSFRYSQRGPLILKEFKLKIPRGLRVGFVGPTGSGKSTALDLLMGLLEPTMGRILVDGLPLNEEILWAWQRTIANVPQNIFLADSTLAENIAFGQRFEDIDMERVRQAARKANISEFIENNTEEGYNALIGERGIRLSGGQRQRIGIARALYKEASVLIFDEATSSLDNATEVEVMEAIEELDTDLTILIIAHRVTTVKNCDMIVKVEQGRAELCSYEQLLT